MLEVEGGTAGVVPADPAPRGRPRASRTPTACAGAGGAASSSAARSQPLSRSTTRRGRTARASSSTSTPGTRRAIPTRTSPRPSRCGSTPARDWRARYAGWPALRKLEYVDELMARARGPAAAGARRGARSSRCRACARRCASTTSSGARTTASTTRDFYDRDLRRLFSDAPEHAARRPRPRFLSPHPQGGAPPRGPLDGRVPVHDRPGARRHDRALPRAEPAPALPPEEEPKLEFIDPAHRADHELPAQRPPPGGAVSAARAAKNARACCALVPCTRASSRPTRRRRSDVDGAPTGRPSTTSSRTLRELGHEVRAARRRRRARRRSATRSTSSSPTSPSTCSRASTTSPTWDQNVVGLPRAAEGALHRLQLARADARRATSR